MALKLDEIRALAERVAASHGLEVVDLEYQGGGGKHRTLRVFIEKNEGERARLRERVARLRGLRAAGESHGGANGQNFNEQGFNEQGLEDESFLEGLPAVENLELLSGVTHEDCEHFSRDFGTVLDVEELGPGTEYLLEVSSPGLDRRLTRAEDYHRFQGSLVKLQTFEPVAGNRHWRGRIAEAREERIVLDLVEKSAKQKAEKRQTKKATQAQPSSIEIALGNVEKANLVPEF